MCRKVKIANIPPHGPDDGTVEPKRYSVDLNKSLLPLGSWLSIFLHIYIYIYIYFQSASEDNGCGLFVYRIYEAFHINLWEWSMYGYCYIFFFFFFGLYNKTHIQSVYNVTGRKPYFDLIVIINLFRRVFVIWRDEDYILHRNKFIITIQPWLSFLSVTLYIYIYIYIYIYMDGYR